MSTQAQNAILAAPVGATSLWRRLGRAIIDRAVSPLFAALLLIYWEFHVRYFAVEALLLPPPSHIAMAFWNGMASGLFLRHFAITIYRALSGFAIASLFGVALGGALSHLRIVEKTVYPWVVALQTVPKIAIAPLILVWCGYGSLSKVVTAALVNTIIGLKSCEQSKLDLMRSLRASRWLTFRLVELPNALPFIFAGLSVAAVFSILGALV